MALPGVFCWTRMGAEAGQSLESILQRKDAEREANGGLFFWGIGNAIGPSVRELLKCDPEPEVIFSPIKSRARREDTSPTAVVAWTQAEGVDGTPFDLPSRALITSRLDLAAPKSTHYALVCAAAAPLTMAGAGGVVDIGELENLLTGRPIGASQVTAIVRRRKGRAVAREYNVVLRARLVPPYFLRLRDPILLPRERDAQEWQSVVANVWASVLRRRQSPRSAAQSRLTLTSQSLSALLD